MTLLAQAAEVGTANTAEVILFCVFSVIALGAGIAVITMRNVVHAALMLVINMLAIAGLYLTLQSGFLSIIQIIVYAGAIMVLFLFVIMLLGVDRDDHLVERRPVPRLLAGLGTVTIAGVLLYAFAGTYTTADSRCGDQAPVATQTGVVAGADAVDCVGMDAALAASESGSVGVVADSLFGRYTFPFEISALLLTVATIGAMLLGRRVDLDDEDDPAYEPSGPTPTRADAQAAIAAADADDLSLDEFAWDEADIGASSAPESGMSEPESPSTPDESRGGDDSGPLADDSGGDA